MGLNGDGGDPGAPHRGQEPAFIVVVNGEGQYSIWPSGRPYPAGWTEGGSCGDRDTCLAHIERTWTDLRPRSLRARMETATPVSRP